MHITIIFKRLGSRLNIIGPVNKVFCLAHYSLSLCMNGKKIQASLFMCHEALIKQGVATPAILFIYTPSIMRGGRHLQKVSNPIQSLNT